MFLFARCSGSCAFGFAERRYSGSRTPWQIVEAFGGDFELQSVNERSNGEDEAHQGPLALGAFTIYFC